MENWVMGFELILKIKSVNFELIKELDEFVFLQ